MNNARIVTSNKALHIVYEILIKDHPESLNHIAIQADGTLTEKLLINLDRKYKYDLVKSVFTGKGELLVPCYKGSKMSFAKLQLE